jgi:hypothetical protein
MTIQAWHKDIKSLIIGDNAQFQIPIYQRTYTWEAKNQVQKLLEDIIEFGREYKENPEAEYYIGNVILKSQGRGFSQERVVIDGQQRITTMILTLCAIRDLCLNKIKTDEAKRDARNIGKALFSEDDGQIKIKLNNMERQSTLITLLTGTLETITHTDKTTNYWEIYQHIYKILDSMESQDFESFVDILDRVKVVVIFLDEAQDENSVFESINSLGKPLSGSDLIKNYLFTFKKYQCSRNDEKLLTDIYTTKFESLFSNEKNVEHELETFFREYIALKTYELVNQNPKVIYYSFKKMVGDIDGFEECKNLIIDITKWGIIYQTLRVGSHKDIDQNNLEYLRTSFLTYSTLLMDIVDKCSRVENGVILVEEKTRLNEALKMVVAYDVCRFLGGFPAKQITRFVPTISKRLRNEDSEYYRDYAGAFKRLVTSASEGFRQPSINSLKRSVVDIDLYNQRKKQALRFLVLMENVNSNEVLSFERDLKGCQIEHIMPQSLPPDGWPISKENHERFLHTLGNLSITFDNQGLSNKPFHEKKELLRQRSRIRLNDLLLDYNKFDEIEICDRSLKILDMFVKTYDVPEFEVEEEFSNNEVNIFEADDPTHQKLEYAIFLDKKLEIKEVSKLYIEVFRQLFKMSSETFSSSEIGTQIKLTDNLERTRVINPVAINDAYFIETCFNNRDKFEKIKNALSVFALEDKLLIKYAQLIDTEKLLRELEG